jgi:hypothetical protein
MVTANEVIVKYRKLSPNSQAQVVEEPCCDKPKPEKRDSELVCVNCGTVKHRLVALPREEDVDELSGGGFKFGRPPSAALVMDNNSGTSPGPERRRQVLSALNQGKRKIRGHRNGALVPGESGVREGLDFHLGQLDLLTIWKMSGDPTDHAVSEILTARIRKIEKSSGRKIRQERVEAIAQACKAGIKNAEKQRRIPRREMSMMVEQVFAKEGFLA